MPTNFDISSYLSDRLNNASNAKTIEIAQAAQDKVAAIEQKRAEFAAERAAEQKAFEQTWVGQLGLTPGGFMANRVNDAASLVSGASRLAGQIAALPSSIQATDELSQLTEPEVQAFNRAQTGKALPGDDAVLARKINGLSVGQKLADVKEGQKTARDIAKAFELGNIVEQSNRNALVEDLTKNFDEQWGSVTKGWKQGKDGDLLEGSSNVVRGLAGLLYSAGSAAVNNPAGVREYIVENAPQLLVGAAGKVGQAAMTAGNIGYAADVYQQGMENYAKANGGQLPPEDVRQRMAIEAASLAAAEQVGDVAGLALGKKAVGASKGAIRNTLKAGAEGFASEAPTEGYQTWAEGEITGKPATAKDIYVGGAIGGMSGAGLTGSLRGVAELTGATPEKQAEAQAESQKRDVFADAVRTGNVDEFLDPKSASYNPEMGIQALKAHADTLPAERKQQAYERAASAVADMDKRLAEMKDGLQRQSKAGLEADLAQAKQTLTEIDQNNPEAVAAVTGWIQGAQEALDRFDEEKAAKNQAELQGNIDALDKQLTASKDSLGQFQASLQSKDLDTEVEAKKITSADPVASQAAASSIINLSMAIPERLNAKTAQALADDTTNHLTDAQRTYFREFSAARAHENSLLSLGDVSKQVFFGRPADKAKDIPRMLGIKDYRKELSAAFASKDKKTADRLLGYLNSFKDDHEQKAQLVADAFEQTQADKANRRLIKTDNGWVVKDGTWISEASRLKNGGLNITPSSAKLPAEIRTEADALNSAHAELSAAYNLTFGEANVENVSPAPRVQASSQQQTEAKAEASADAGTASNEQGSSEPDVSSNESADTGEETKPAGVTEVTEEPPASSAKTAETDSTETTQETSVETQSTQESTTDSQSDASSNESTEGTLSALSQKAEEGASYENLKAGDLFVQKLGDEEGSTRPLVAVKNFFTMVTEGKAKVVDYLKGQTELTDGQSRLVSVLNDRLQQWSPKIKANLKPRAEAHFNYEDPIRYFITEGDLDENMKSAMVAGIFAFMADQAGRDRINGQGAINAILNRPEDTPIDPLAWKMLGKVGVYRHILADSLGAKVLDALGLKGNALTAGQDLEAKLKVSLGAHMLKLMEDVGLVESTTYTNKQMAQLADTIYGADENEGHVFYKVKEDADGNLMGEGKYLYDSVRGTESLINRLFGMEEAVKFAYLAPSTRVQQETKTGMGIPKFLKELVFGQKAQEPWVVDETRFGVLGQFSLEQAHQIFGVEEITSDNTHADDVVSKEAKNAGLIREYALFTDFVGNEIATTADRLKTPFYLGYDVWVQQRVGVDTSAVSPQASKIVRWLVSAPSWTTTIKTSDEARMRTFKLKVAEGFGIKPEKGESKKAEEKLLGIMQQPRMAQGLAAMQKAVAKEALTEDEKQHILNAIEDGGQRTHTLAALAAYAEYQNAMEAGNAEFTTNLMGEVDGVSNGTILNHVLYGAADSPKALNEMLESGGIYGLASKFAQYNLWRGTPGNLDTYEGAAASTAQMLQGRDKDLVAALWATGGKLIDDEGAVLGEGRNLMKIGINPLNYGSGTKSIVDKVAGQYIETIRQKLAELSASEASQEEVDAYITQLNVVLVKGKASPLQVGLPIKAYMGYKTPTFTAQQINALKDVYGRIMGQTMSGVIGEKFEPLLAATKQGVRQSNMMFSLYAALYQHERNQILAGVPKKKNGQPFRDLTKAEEDTINKKLKDFLPVINTAMSAAENDPTAGVLMADNEKQTSGATLYKVGVNFGQPLKSGKSSMALKSQDVALEGPGVAMVANTTQSTDSRISHLSQVGRQVFNMHDALGDGVGTLGETALALNTNTWTALIEYSPLMEAHKGLMRMVQTVVAMEMAGQLTPEMVTALQKAIFDLQPAKSELESQDWFARQVSQLYGRAALADKTKFEAMSQWAVIDQYTFDGGSYEVTNDQRAEAAQKAAEVKIAIPVEEEQLLADFNRIVFGKNQQFYREKEVVATPFGETGEARVKSEPTVVALFRQNGNELGFEDVAAFLKTKGLTGYRGKLLELAVRTLRQVNPDLKLKMITPETKESDVLALPKSPSRGWFVGMTDGKGEIYLLGPEFKSSGLTIETLLHEMVHAALAQIVHNPAAKDGAAELVAELQTVLTAAQEFVTKNRMDKFAPAVSDLQELLAWGMTNVEFQDKVLKQIRIKERTTTGNRFLNAMTKFIETLSQMLFPGRSPAATNALQVLIEDTSALFAAAAEETTDTSAMDEINLSMAAQPEAVKQWTTQEVFDALDVEAVSPSFQGHLGKLLSGMVTAVYGPFGAFRDALQSSTATTPMDVWLKAIETGKVPFASDILNSGFAASHQEEFVMQQVEATVATALDINDITTKPAYRELYKLYMEAKEKLTPQDFEDAGFDAKDWDFVFGVQAMDGDRSAYLSRFAAIGLANERFKGMLDFETEAGRAELGNAKSIFDRLVRIFEKILSFFNHKATNTYAGQKADAKLEALVDRLMDIEAKYRFKAQAGESAFSKYEKLAEDMTKGTIDAAKQKILDIVQSPMVQKSSSGLVKWSGALVNVAAGGKAMAVMNSLRSLRDHAMDERDGVLAGLLREAKGPSELLQNMILITKHSENLRQNAIGQTADILMKEFEGHGQNLTKEQKSALTSVFLRSGAHNLLGQYSLPEIANLLKDPSALAQAIADTEARLSTTLKDQHIEQAHGLGYWKATDLNAVPWLMKNAYVIARMLGTQYAGKITEQQAAQEQGVIAELATLYAIKYSKVSEQQAAAAVLSKELTRQDGNGVELLLKLHKEMELESQERLFNGNPIQMTHGYTPEIYDPYVTIKVANDLEGKDLIAQGFVKGESIASDKDVPDANGFYGLKQHFYIRRDGGLNRRVSGALSLTSDGQAKGTTIHNGYMNTNTYVGALNQSMQVEVTNKKMAALGQAKNIHRDMSQNKTVNVAPIYDDQGNVVNWAYMMGGKTKNTLLKRENRFEKVMGTFAGSIIDKHTSKELNEKSITALRDQYDSEAGVTPWSYIEVSSTSSDPEMRELWALLPDHTKLAVRKIWGRDAMMVRKDSLDGVFGYRKLSASDFLMKERADLEGMQRFLRGLFHSYAQSRGMDEEDADNWAKRLGVAVLKGERGWQEVYKEVKDIVVVKNLVTLVGNVYSNASLLWLLGVKDAWAHQVTALRGIMAYEKDHKRLMELQAKLDAGYSGINVKATELEIARLKDAMARNPVTKLVDAGLMPTIVEDVDLQDDPYSYKSQLGEKLEAFGNRVPEGVKKVAKTIYMTHDTPLYKLLSRATQYSDFVARYAMYQHLTTNEGKTHSEAIGKALNAFVHYDVPMQRNLQYLDDMGFTPFMKYFYRIQRVLLETFKERPARALSMVLMNRMVDLGPIVLDSSFVHHAGNIPLKGGAANFPFVLDELLPVKALGMIR